MNAVRLQALHIVTINQYNHATNITNFALMPDHLNLYSRHLVTILNYARRKYILYLYFCILCIHTTGIPQEKS